MNKLRALFTYVFPRRLLEGSSWADLWDDKEQSDFAAAARLILPVAAVAYLGHYVLFDRAMGLEPTEKWLQFRVAMAAIGLLAFSYYLTPLAQRRFYRIPAALAFLAFCYSQGRVTVYYPEAPWIYCFVFTALCSIALRTSVLKSMSFAVIAFGLQWSSLFEAGVAVAEVVSATIVTLIGIIIARGSYAGEIRYFRLNQESLAAQRRNIEMNIEFLDRIKAFIPGEIADRLTAFIERDRMTVLQAIDEVLRPREREITCLFSDIRGFTQGSKDLDAYVKRAVLPNLKECTRAIEQHGGIPRKIGDLLFAYFDNRSVHLNLLRAVIAGLAVAQVSESQNNTLGRKVLTRYILISTGEAIVGNVGGFDSSIEITALGSPVNFLSRIDELTKDPALANKLSSSDLILCERSFALLTEMKLQAQVSTIDLCELGLQVRDFPETTKLYALRPTDHNTRALLQPYEKLNVRSPYPG